MDKRTLSHDITNMIERLKIMHELVKNQRFSEISKEQLKKDLGETLKKLDERFSEYLQ